MTLKNLGIEDKFLKMDEWYLSLRSYLTVKKEYFSPKINSSAKMPSSL